MVPDFDPRQRAVQVRLQAEDELHSFPWWIRPCFRWTLNKTRRGAVLRESAKSMPRRVSNSCGLVLLEVGQRMAERRRLSEAREVFHLAGIEVEAYLNGEWSGTGATELVEDRKRNLERWKLETPFDVLVEKQTQAAALDAIKEAERENVRAVLKWRGVAAAQGWPRE